MNRVRDLEKALARAEGWLCVVLVLLMLVLAGYNVLYRNVLVPLQTHWAHSGPPVQRVDPEATVAADGARTDRPEASKSGPGAGGFGGAFGGGAEEATADTDEDPLEGDDADEEGGGFGGAFGADPEEDDEAELEEADEGGFGGAFGKPAKPAEGAPDEDIEELLADDEFEDLPDISAVAEAPTDAGEPLGGPPEPGSFADRGVKFIDAIKLDWIDVFLRQLVIIVSFLGAAIATRRRKHINIDAMSKLLGSRARRWADVLTNLLALGVCVVLAVAGKRLVEIGLEYPRKIVPFADEWVFQLMFPLGFGLLAVHFTVRLLEAATGTVEPEAVETTAAADPLEDGKAAQSPSAAAGEPESDEPDGEDSVTSVESAEDTEPQDETAPPDDAADSGDDDEEERR